jgi:CxxC motif-containing protein (DUF1111 family)
MSKTGKLKLLLALVVVSLFAMSQTNAADFGGSFRAKDPGVRVGPAGAGGPFLTLTAEELAMFNQGRDDFAENEDVGDGVGPRFNAPGCAFCHSQPDIGGTSPAVNPLFRILDPNDSEVGGFHRNNVMPSFIKRDGPIREARFKFNPDGSRDGGVHNLFVIAGHADAPGCDIRQEDFEKQIRNNNIIFRIPSPTFGAGLIEQIKDSAILANLANNSSKKRDLGISGRVNRNGNDGTITRFGWKAQNKSLQIFSGEAYNVEMGITNESFQQEREEDPNCQFAGVPNDVTENVETLNAVDNFSNFQRFLAPPKPSPDTPGGATSIGRGKQQFSNVGCALCHTPTLKTPGGPFGTTVGALRNQDVNLYSDLALHNMGRGLADDIIQGLAQGNEFRTAPLWGLGKRIFFLHDGRTTDLIEAIQEHRSDGSEANRAVDNYNRLDEKDQQDLLNFLRSL